MISGIINVLKPAGITSNAVLSKIKRTLRPNKIGHLGTLDPSATGVLPVCINRATKLFDLYLKKDKHYRAVFVFGKETDTLDSDGIVINENSLIVSRNMLDDVLKSFVGRQKQMPPKYSAKKINGQTAYTLARNNVDFELNPREIVIYAIKVVEELGTNMFLIDIKCSSGTYIRSIARDIAYSLGTFGYMAALIRISSGNFELKDSVNIDQITENSIISIENCLKDKQKVFVPDKFYDKMLNGCKIDVDLQNCEDVIVFCNGELIGIGDVNFGQLKIKTFLWEKND